MTLNRRYVTEVGIRTSAALDLYVVLAGVREETAELRISFNPLVVWVWIAAAALALPLYRAR